MKKILALVILSLIISGCNGFLYNQMPVLEFEQIDYGYPVKKSSSSPSIAYIDQGTGSETIILIHGLASNAGFWRYNIGELSKKYRVIAVDLPGYGKSQKGFTEYTLSFFALSIKNLMDELKIQKAVIAGHSMGGQTASIFGLKYPERVSALVLAAPAGFEAFKKGEGDWLRNALNTGSIKLVNEEAARRNLANNFYNWSDKFEWLVEERVRMSKASEFPEFAYTVIKSISAMLDEPTSKRIANLTMPVLIVYGKYDGLIPNMYLHPGFPSDVFVEGAAKIKNSKLVEIDDCGHMLQIEKPEAFNSAVIKFLEEK
ncbi:MAG: alpha/beta hydrolase [Ignavibacteriaceae bacterium]|nr:alpha/beta hydrolase [Ignavibacteriaceae bacterium]